MKVLLPRNTTPFTNMHINADGLYIVGQYKKSEPFQTIRVNEYVDGFEVILITLIDLAKFKLDSTLNIEQCNNTWTLSKELIQHYITKSSFQNYISNPNFNCYRVPTRKDILIAVPKEMDNIIILYKNGFRLDIRPSMIDICLLYNISLQDYMDYWKSYFEREYYKI